MISLPSALIVAGGFARGGYIDTVEIFKLDTYQWYVTDPLPITCSNMAAYSIGEDTCYLLGGTNLQHASTMHSQLHLVISFAMQQQLLLASLPLVP